MLYFHSYLSFILGLNVIKPNLSFFFFYKNQFNEPTKCQAHLKQFEIASKHGPKCINLNHSILFVKISFEQLGTQEKLLPASTIDDRTTHINKYAHLCRFFLFT